MTPEHSCRIFPNHSERTDPALLEPRVGELPKMYVERLSETVYPGDLKRSILEAYRLCLEIGCVARVCIKHFPDLPLTRAYELYDPESLEEACSKAMRAKGTTAEEEWDKEFCFGASVRLQPEVMSQVIWSLNSLGHKLRTHNRALHRERSEAFHYKTLNSLAKDPLAVGILKLLPRRLRNWLLEPVVREDLSLGTWDQIFRDQDNQPKATAEGASPDGVVELSDFELQACSLGAVEFWRYGIDVKAAFFLQRLVDDYYQLSGKLLEHQERLLERGNGNTR